MKALQDGDPRHVGRYRLLGRLGAGGMGQVFLGESPGGRKVAVKLIRPEHAANDQFRERFAREVAAARRVGGFHTALVIDADTSADPPWMVSAYIHGPSLEETVHYAPLEHAATRALGAALAEGLDAIHACGLVHRDLKPGNIIMADDGPRIIDFGIARVADASTLTSAGAVIGTFTFMSPEQVSGKRVGPESDVFSLGSVLFFAATGRGPFAAPYPAVIHRILALAPDLGQIHSPLREVIAGCLSKDPRGRPTAAEILARLSGRPALPSPRQQPTPLANERPVASANPRPIPVPRTTDVEAGGAWPASASPSPRPSPAKASQPSPGDPYLILLGLLRKSEDERAEAVARHAERAEREAKRLAARQPKEERLMPLTWSVRASAWLLFLSTIPLYRPDYYAHWPVAIILDGLAALATAFGMMFTKVIRVVGALIALVSFCAAGLDSVFLAVHKWPLYATIPILVVTWLIALAGIGDAVEDRKGGSRSS